LGWTFGGFCDESSFTYLLAFAIEDEMKHCSYTADTFDDYSSARN